MIFCVEDDNGIRDLMIYTLNTAGMEAKGFADGTELFRALLPELPDLIMLDIMLPGEDGISILKKLFLSSLLTPNSRNINNIYRAMLNGTKL